MNSDNMTQHDVVAPQIKKIIVGHKVYSIKLSTILECIPNYMDMCDYDRNNINYIKQGKFNRIKNSHLFLLNNNYKVVIFPDNTPWKYNIRFPKNKIHCGFNAPVRHKYVVGGGWIKDLTTEGIESNPGPSIQKMCLSCGDLMISADIIEKYICNKCLDGYHPQAIFTQEATNSVTQWGNGLVKWLGDGNYHGNSFIEHYIDIPDEASGYVSLLEDILILLHNMLRSKGKVDTYTAIVTFCKLRGARPGFVQILTFIASDILGSVAMATFRKDPLYNEICNRVDYNPQAFEEEENVFSQLRYYLSFYTKLQETAIYKKLYKFLLYLLASEMLVGMKIDFDSCNFDKMEAAAIKRTHKPGFDMLHCLLDTMCFVCERGLYFVKTGEVSSIFHSGTSYEKWFIKSSTVIRTSRLLSNPEPHGIDRFTYLNDLKDAIEKGTSILKFTSGLDKYEKMTIGKMLNDLQMIESSELTRKAAQMPRKDPFAVLIHGSSSICKSQLKQILFYHYGKIFNRNVSADYMYTRCPTDEYWSGFNSTQWCIVMDDIAFLKPNGEVDPTLKEMLQVKNSVPYCPPQAALEDKGRTPVRAELLIGTTNTKHLNLHAYFACPFAIARRLSYIITAIIKPEYSKQTIMADSAKIPVTPDGEYMNIWNFSISVPIPEVEDNIDCQGTRYKEIHVFTEIDDMLQWYIGAAKDHEISQSKAMAADKTMMDVNLCCLCYRTVKKCTCERDTTDNLYSPQNDSATETITDIETELLTGDYTQWFRFKCWYIANVLRELDVSFNFLNYYLDKMYPFRIIILICIACIFSRYPWLSIVSNIYLLMWYYLIKYFWILNKWYWQFHYGDYWKVRLCYHIVGCESQARRLIFRTRGHAIQQKFFTNEKLLRAAAIIAGLVVCLRNVKWACSIIRPSKEKDTVSATPVVYNDQGAMGTVPIAHTVEKPTFYYQDPYTLTDVDISSQSKTVQGDILINKIERNTARVNFDFIDATSTRATAICIRGQCWLLNAHVVKNSVSLTGSVSFVFEDINQNVSRNIKNIAFDSKDFKFLPNTDLVMMNIRAISPGINLYDYFLTTGTLKGSHHGSYVLKNADGISEVRPVVNVLEGKCTYFGISAYHSFAAVPTQKGHCGSALVISAGTAQIIGGIHTSGNNHTGGAFAQLVTKDMLDKLLSHYGPQVDCNEIIPISQDGYIREIKTLSERSTLRWLETGTATIYGSFTGFRPKHKSKVKDTFICDEVIKDGYKKDCGPPDMTYRPWHNAIKDMTVPNYTFHNSVLDECKDSFLCDILSGLSSDALRDVEVYTEDVALNGVDGITFVDRLNIRTSAGNPFKKSKLHFIELDDSYKITGVKKEIRTRIDLIQSAYDSGKRFHPQFCGHLKDDPMPWKKIETGMTRLFTGGEFAWSVVVRKYLLSHIRLIQNNPFLFEAMPGIVAQSEEWQKLYTHITTFGKDRIIAGDYGKFDKKMAAAFILAAFDILRGIAKAAKWSEEDLKVIDCIAQDTAFPNIDFNGDLIEIQGNPSGHPLTVIINCLVNSLYMRYAFKLISGKPLSKFKKYVRLATYGDDNIMGVSPECPNFNHTRIAVAMAAIGVKYTMAEKEAESIPYIHISDSSFLKRKFVYDKDIDSIIAPLDHSSIDKMLTSHLDNGVLAPEAHSICAIETALREYFYYGKDKFLERRAYFQELIIRCKLQYWVKSSTFPTYDELAYSFWMRFNNKEKAKKFITGDLPPTKATSKPDSLEDDYYSC